MAGRCVWYLQNTTTQLVHMPWMRSAKYGRKLCWRCQETVMTILLLS